jgi:hypothetical protein
MPTIPGEVLEELRSNLAQLRLRDPERRTLVARTAFLFHRSEKTVYRQLAQVAGPKRCTRKDQGHARYPVESEFRRWIEMVAAIHDDHTDKRHIHALAVVKGRLKREDLQALIHAATEEAQLQRHARDLMREVAEVQREREEAQWGIY